MRLHVVVVQIRDRNRARRVEDMLRFVGERVRSGVFEVVGTPERMSRLEREIGSLVGPQDTVRIYPLCGRCRPRVRLFGDGDVAQVPIAWIF